MSHLVTLTLTVTVELKDGYEVTERREGDPRFAWKIDNPAAGAVHWFGRRDVVEKIHDVLADDTKHDDTIGWRVTAVGTV